MASGLPASPGAAMGEIVLDSDEAEAAKAAGRKVILVRVETSPEDIHGMHAAEGILTARGGMTSHAAVVARGMGKPCVSGAGMLKVDMAAGTITASGVTLKKGDFITIDGSTGQVLLGQVKMIEPELSGEFGTLMGWADKVRRMKVRANAETPLDARTARNFGAEGIGLCRTEHMFFEGERIVAVREMILADDTAGRRQALAKLLPMQRADFVELFTIMQGLPVTIRLLDPPLHEFLPHSDEEIAEVAAAMGASPEKLRARALELHEFNPMLGFRGASRYISSDFAECFKMECEALKKVRDEMGLTNVEIMVPFVRTVTQAQRVIKLLGDNGLVRGQNGLKVVMMCEVPSNAILADQFLEHFDGFSIGSNDMTQLTLGLDRDSGCLLYTSDAADE